MPLRWSRQSRSRVDTRTLDVPRLHEDFPTEANTGLGTLTCLVAATGLLASLLLLTSP
jgi:hypothetical protein